LKPPVADHDSILNFYNALTIAPSVAKFLSTTDPSGECISVSTSGVMGTMDMNTALASPQQLALLAERLPHSPQGSSPDYWIGGTVVQLANGKLEFHTYLHTATDEVVVSTSGQIDFYPGGDVYLEVTKSMLAQMSPLYDKIREFETKKRDSGPPYAIKPTLECTLAKRSLDFSETTTLHFKLTDCDEEVLKNRHVSIDNCDLGTLDKMSFTTDDNGEADLHYTAPASTAGIADIQISFSYTEPWATAENQKTKEGHVEIEIKAPPDSWSLYAIYTFTEIVNSRESRSDGYSASSQTHEAQSNNICAWIKKMNIPNVPKNYFVAELTPLAMTFSGHNTSRGQDRSFWSNPAAYIKTEGWFNTFADVEPTATPKYNISINNKNHTFNFQKLDATQTGKYISTSESYDPTNGFQTSSSETPADSKRSLNWNTNGYVSDTSYSYHTTDALTDSRQNFTQTCTWNDTLFLLKLNKDFVSETTIDTSIETPDGTIWLKEYSKTIQQYRIYVKMEYNEGTPSAMNEEKQLFPKDYELFQNYPNPFNPSTTIRYGLPSESRVTIKIYNTLGQRIAVIVNTEQSAGWYEAVWNAKGASGLYFYRIDAVSKSDPNQRFVQLKKMLLLR
jgi:hypothetical protein